MVSIKSFENQESSWIELNLLRIVFIDQLHICLVQRPNPAKEIEFATVCCFAPKKKMLDLIDILAWFCASLRTSTLEEPSVSHTLLFKTSTRSRWRFYMSLAKLKINMPDPRPCWYTLIPRSVIAKGFPIPARNGENGMELPLEVMITISRIFTLAIVDGKYYFLGVFTALIPTKTFGHKSLQWHFIQNSHKRIFPQDLPRTSVLSAKEFEEVADFKVLFYQLSRRRHFLGWCEFSQITLGTEIGTYTLRSTDAPEPSKSLQVQNFGANIGTPGMGFLNAGVTANFTISSTRVPQDHGGLLHYESILRRARRLPYIIFDVDTKRAWFVPAICVILHMVHLRTQREHKKANVPYAQSHRDGGEAAFEVMMVHRRDSLGFEDREDPYTLEHMVQEIWLGLDSCPQKPFKKRLFLRDILYAYELMDIVTTRRFIRLKEIEVEDTGGWINLTKTVPLVLLSRAIGEAVSISTDARTCWSTVPTNNYLLCATIKSLKALSDDLGGAHHKLMQDQEWHCPGLLFQKCVCTDTEACNRLQQLVRSGSVHISPQKFPEEGAVIFGKCLKFGSLHSSCSSEVSTSAKGPELRADRKYQRSELVNNSILPRMQSQASSHNSSSIYSLGVNPPLLPDEIRSKSHHKNIASYRDCRVLQGENGLRLGVAAYDKDSSIIFHR